MKVGIRLKIDVSKIDKDRLFKGAKGTYLDATTFVDLDNKDQYDQNGFIAQDVSKEESDAGQKGAIIGNVAVFWRDGSSGQPSQQPAQSQPENNGGFADDIPFAQHQKGFVV